MFQAKYQVQVFLKSVSWYKSLFNHFFIEQFKIAFYQLPLLSALWLYSSFFFLCIQYLWTLYSIIILFWKNYFCEICLFHFFLLCWSKWKKRITGETIFKWIYPITFCNHMGFRNSILKASSPTKTKYIFFTTEWALKTFFSGTAKHNKKFKNTWKNIHSL